MRLYRGQTYGMAVGSWWTTNIEDARAYACSRSSSAWVVLSFEADGRKLAPYLFDRTGAGSTYRLPRKILMLHVMAVRLVDGFLSLHSEIRP